ncbi:Uncharacterized membrane protein SpoIIM, required for sporulation [Spirosomataceae bacterium TFI 002]|nr:Uncharacterized membrane protein SpoIIM, required for sporulation [Spirosomataceae bacterium TFI 002]
MRESTFIHRNKDKWERIENDPDPTETDLLAEDFVSLLNDVSYSKTHYPHSNLTVYLNKLASRLYNRLYFKSKNERNPFKEFWVEDFPSIIGKNIKVLYIASGLFLLFLSLGLACAYLEPSFIQGIMGEEYLSMTQDNIANGKPFGVYNDESKMKMFVRIFSNNVFVGLLIFTMGIFLGLGSIYLTLKNGVMIGAFFAIFIQNSLGIDAFFVIMLHGTFELMGLVLECMAGMLLGMSFLFPGTLKRKQAFVNGLKMSSKIYLGTLPFTFLAAVIESFVTYLGQEGLAKTSPFLIAFLSIVLLGSWIIVIWYFFFFSRKKASSYTDQSFFEKVYA